MSEPIITGVEYRNSDPGMVWIRVSEDDYDELTATPPLDVPDGPSFSVMVDSALTRIEQLLTPLDSTPQGQRRWADVDTALDVAHAARRYIGKHARLAQQGGTGE